MASESHSAANASSSLAEDEYSTTSVEEKPSVIQSNNCPSIEVESVFTGSSPNTIETLPQQESQYSSYSSLTGILFAPLLLPFSMIRWATEKVNDNVVLPVSAGLTASIVNPVNLSALMWQRIKNMTPQRARDITRIISCALSNSVGILTSQPAQNLSSTNKILCNDIKQAIASHEGRQIVMNSAAFLVKVAEALNTRESKQALQQISLTMNSLLDFLRSPKANDILNGMNKSVDQLIEVANAPETMIFLAEVTANICHALEVEDYASKMNETVQDSETYVPTTKSTNDAHVTTSKEELNASARRRCLQIENEILQRMGINVDLCGIEKPTLSEQNSLSNQIPTTDTIKADTIKADTIKADITQADITQADITQADITQADLEHTDVILPEWHPEEIHNAVRKRCRERKEQKNNALDKNLQSKKVIDTLKTHQSSTNNTNKIELVAVKIIQNLIMIFVVVWTVLGLYGLCKIVSE